MRLPSHFHAGGLGGGAMAASAESACDAPCATNVTELPSFLERVACVEAEHVLERRLGPEARFELVRRTHGANTAAVHQRHPIAQLLGFFHVVGRSSSTRPRRCSTLARRATSSGRSPRCSTGGPWSRSRTGCTPRTTRIAW